MLSLTISFNISRFFCYFFFTLRNSVKQIKLLLKTKKLYLNENLVLFFISRNKKHENSLIARGEIAIKNTKRNHTINTKGKYRKL